MNQFYLYRHIRLDKNEVFYVGIGKKPKKYNGHRTEYKRAFTSHKRTKFWKQIVSKTEYRVEIMLESDNLDFIKEREIEFISLYGRKDQKKGTLVNLTDGGELNNSGASRCRKNFTVSPEARRKISERNTGNKASEETRMLLSEMRKDPYFHKHLLTPEAIEKAKISRRNNLKQVIDIKTGQVFNSLPDACEIYGIILNSEHNRIKRNSKKATFKYLKS